MTKKLTDAELDALCNRLRNDAARWSDEMVMGSLEREAADAIAALREQVAEKHDAEAYRMLLEDRQRFLDRAIAAEADNAALRQENAELRKRLGPIGVLAMLAGKK